MVDGYKTYIVAVAAIVYSIAGWIIGQIDGGTAGELIFGALAAAGLRHGMQTGA